MMAPMEWTGVAAGASVAAAALVAAAWEGLLLAGVVAVCLRVLPGITAAARSIVWTVVMLAVCGLPFVRFGSAGSGSASIHIDERVGLGLVAVWAALSAVRAAQLIRSAVWLRGVWRRALPVEDYAGKGHYGDSGFARMTSARGMASVGGRAVELCVSEEVDRPCVVGFFRPRILVPTALFEEISDGELAQIVLHEMEHLRRRDDWTNLLQKLSLVVFPLNPALIWIERQLCVERELACDDQVLKTTGARKAYAACLANLAEHSLVRRGVSLALGAWERRSEVVRRVHRILAGSGREMGRRQVAGVVAVLMAGILAGADGLAHAPALVSFGPGASSNVAAVDAPTANAPLYKDARFVGLKPSATSEVPVRATDVVYRPAAKRVIPAKKVSKPKVDAEKLASNTGHREVGTGPMVVMVRWTATMPLIVQDLQFTYAAVPTRNGWLFVQL